MNERSNNLFWKRNINIHNTSSEEIYFDRNKKSPFDSIHIVSEARYPSLSKDILKVQSVQNKEDCSVFDKFNEQSFHNQLKPLFLALRAFGGFPVEFAASGVPRFRLLSLATAYSVCFYLLICTVICLNNKDRVLHVFRKEYGFDNSIYNGILLLIMVNYACVPVLEWLDVQKVIQYIVKWSQFQASFAKLTGEQIVLDVKRRSTIIVLFFAVSGLAGFSFTKFTSQLSIWDIPCCYVSGNILSTVIALWHLVSSSLAKTGTALNSCFKRDLRQRTLSAEMIGEYRILWLRWSQLVSQTGLMMGKVFGFYLILLLVTLTISLYGFLSGFNDKTIDAFRAGFMGSTCMGCSLALYGICNSAHYLANIVGVGIRNELQLVIPSQITEDILQEVNSFLETIVMSPPVISVAGFANINRGLFRAYASTIVTYMIVLVQFDQSQNYNECNANKTMTLP